jgi:hypothetical protein
MNGSLTGKLSLNLGFDVNGDCHGHPSKTDPTPPGFQRQVDSGSGQSQVFRHLLLS